MKLFFLLNLKLLGLSELIFNVSKNEILLWFGEDKYFTLFWYYLIFFNLFSKFQVKYEPNFQNAIRKLVLKREKEIFQNY